MKLNPFRNLFALCLLAGANASAEVRFVDVNSTNPTPPYTNWATAATNIQNAVDAALAGDEVLVANGVYDFGGGFGPGSGGVTHYSRVVLSKALSVRSVNGPQVTVIKGGIATRCVYIVDHNATLSGFTLTNGTLKDPLVFTAGGGAYCWGTNAVITNCLIIGNSADYGGGVYGERGCRIINCTVVSNTAWHEGGGVACTRSLTIQGGGFRYLPGCAVIDSTLEGNSASYYGGAACGIDGRTGNPPGGGFPGRCLLINCMLTNNSAYMGGAARLCDLINCRVTSNYSDSSGVADSCALTSCVLTGNFPTAAGYSTLINCTVVGNIGLGATASTLRNCILYGNTQGDQLQCQLNYCSATELPESGEGNIAGDPQLNWQEGLHPGFNSPCINAGNNNYVTTTTDLDGNPRISGGTVDIGAYEFQSPASVLSYAWAQQHGLPTDGSADYLDSDNDLVNNWQEWIAGTIPTDVLSALRLLNPVKVISGIAVSWQSVSNRTYFLERATDLGAAPPFSLVASNLVGQAGTTSFTDTNAVDPGPYFYRVGVQ